MAELDAFDRGLESAFLRLVDEVPSEVDGIAVAHRVAREHPRGRVRGASFGRVAVPGFAWLLLLTLLLAALGAAALLAGAKSTVLPAPVTPEVPPDSEVTSVTGSATCVWIHLYGEGAGPELVVGAPLTCTVTTNDPRVSGTETLDPWQGRQWGGTSWKEGAGVQWGSVRLESTGGAWEGTGSGVYSSDRGEIVVSWFRGIGGYAGLGYFELRTGEWPRTIRGLIFPGDPPDLAGIPAVTGQIPSPNVTDTPAPIPAGMPRAIAYGPVSVVEGTSAYTYVDLGSGTYAGVDQVTDPRVSGRYLAPSWTTHFWGATGDSFGTGIQWGPTRLETADGTWQGVGSGILDERGDVIAMWYTGSGSYAGLAYFELLGSPNLFDPTIPVDRYGVFGQIFPGSPPTP